MGVISQFNIELNFIGEKGNAKSAYVDVSQLGKICRGKVLQTLSFTMGNLVATKYGGRIILLRVF